MIYLVKCDLRGQSGDLQGQTGDLRAQTGDLHGQTGDLQGQVYFTRSKLGGLRSNLWFLEVRSSRTVPKSGCIRGKKRSKC